MVAMRFHVLGLASTQTTSEYSMCAYTQKVINFCRMMVDRGHTVFLYAGDQNEAPCSEHIVCYTEEERKMWLGDKHYHDAEHSPTAPHWMAFNGRCLAQLSARAKVGDFLCIIFGYAQKPVADACRVPMAVEYGVGYHATFAQFRVFESYAWMHTVYGAEAKTSDRNGIFYDAVIPGYFDERQFFRIRAKKRAGLAFIGRVIERKGITIAKQVADVTGRKLIVAGKCDNPELVKGCEYVGPLGVLDRNLLMSSVEAVLAPTIYIEPFGNVVIEAMACGTPVITTDWGAFTETVKHGVTGFRCRILQDFVDAVEAVGSLDNDAIREYAFKTFGLRATATKYEAYFRRLQTLWGTGWDQLRERKRDQC